MICGCGVVSPRPVGETPTNLQNHQDEWEGTWILADGAMSIKVVDATNGVLAITTCDLKAGKYSYETGAVYLRDGGGWTFANYEQPDGTNQPYYVWGRILKEPRAYHDRDAVMWHERNHP
jgi:hypothetical protein